MTRITVDLGALRTLLTSSAPFAGDDHSLPVLNTILLEGKGKWLVATATDRYSLGMARAEVEGADGFRALVKLADARHILKLFSPAKGQARVTVSLTVEDRTDTASAKLKVDRDDGLFADCDSLTATYSLVDGEFPKTASLFHNWKPSTDRSTSGFNPEYLARFQHVTSTRGEPIRVTFGNDRGLTVVQAGDYFLGAIMPVRLSDDSPVKDLAAWTDVIGEAPKSGEITPADLPAKKAVAKKAPARKRAVAKVAA